MEHIDSILDGTSEEKKIESLMISLRGWEDQQDYAAKMIDSIKDKIRRVEAGEMYEDVGDGPIPQPFPDVRYEAPEGVTEEQAEQATKPCDNETFF